MILAIIITELLVAIKFDYETITKPIPQHIAYFWILGFVGKTNIKQVYTVNFGYNKQMCTLKMNLL